jgi:hypothetical protein
MTSFNFFGPGHFQDRGLHRGLGDQIVRAYPVWGFRGTNLYLCSKKERNVARFAHTYSEFIHFPSQVL